MLLELLLPLLLTTGTPAAPVLSRYQFEQVQMGMPIKLTLYAADQRIANAGAEAVFQEFSRLNRILSDYDPESELSQLSGTAGSGRPVGVSQSLWNVLFQAQQLSERSNGAFDVSVGPFTQLWRRSRRQRELPAPERLEMARQAVGYRHLVLDETEHSVQLRQPGMRLDLGGIAAGYALDQSLRLLRRQGLTHVLLDASGDILVGDPPPGQSAWRIGVARLDAHDPTPSCYLRLANQAVTTSGDAFQFVELNGKRYSHIVDPHTGLGLTARRSVTLVAPTATTADSLATAVCVLGPEEGLRLVQATPDTAALLVEEVDGKIQTQSSADWLALVDPSVPEKQPDSAKPPAATEQPTPRDPPKAADTVTPPSTQLPAAEQIRQVIESPLFRSSHWGLLFVDLKTGEVLYEHQADKLFAPASVTKLFSVAAALEALGPDYRFQTPVVRQGSLDDAGTLTGDLILVAQGDPTLGGRTDDQGHIAFTNQDHTYAEFNGKAELTAPDPLAGLKALAAQVAAAGIKRVTGEVLIDTRLFQTTESTGSGPRQVTPILVNDNLVDLTLKPTEPGQLAAVEVRPQSKCIQIDIQARTVDSSKPSSVWIQGPVGQTFVVLGNIAAGSRPRVMSVEVADPAQFARALFIEQLEAHQVEVDAKPLAAQRRELLPSCTTVSQLPQVAVLRSPPFAENARLVLKVSHNLHASTLPLLIAVQREAHPSQRDLAHGLRHQRDILAQLGVPVESISFGGGAGGARADYVTPRAAVQLLVAMTRHRAAEAYRQGLPVLGVDGTLATAVSPDSPARGQVLAKTGTLIWHDGLNDRSLLNSKALAGYLNTAGGRQVAFAMMINQMPLTQGQTATTIGQTLGRLCEIGYQAW